MSISCDMAGDLLPLYLDDSCSADSRAALEEHLKKCPQCRASLERMGRTLGKAGKAAPEEPVNPPLADYARRVKKRRLKLLVLSLAVILTSAVVLTLCGLTVADMRRQGNPHIFQVEPGVCNLTAGDLSVAAEEAGEYVLYTNNEKIQVTVGAGRELEGTVQLWSAESGESPIQEARVTGREPVCTFTNLTASMRYRVVCEGLDGGTVTISEGRAVSFWDSLGRVVREMTGW